MWLWRIKQPVVYEDVQWQEWPDISQLSIFPQPIRTLLMGTMMQLSEFPVHLISCKSLKGQYPLLWPKSLLPNQFIMVGFHYLTLALMVQGKVLVSRARMTLSFCARNKNDSVFLLQEALIHSFHVHLVFWNVTCLKEHSCFCLSLIV